MIIDVHGHVTSPALFKRFPMPPSLADIDGMIEQKLQAGIGLTIVGSPVGEGTMMRVPGLDNYAQPPEQLKAFHGWLAETVAKHPGRLKAYCYTNPFGGDRLLQETAKTVRDGGFVGLIVNTSVRGLYLDSDQADSFFAMAAELDVPIFLHPPAEPVGSDRLSDFRLVEQVGRFCDVTVSLAVLAFSGRMEKYPNLQFIGATAGGAIALLVDRLDLAYQPRHWARKPHAGSVPPAAAGGPPSGSAPAGPMIQQYENKISQKPSTYVKRLWVDTACFSLPGLLSNLQTVGVDHMLFGTDSPPLATPLEDAISLINKLPISDADKQKIFSDNAKRLFQLGDTP
jgi:aminocarboxymuconate-semialdehyde decarboxylase